MPQVTDLLKNIEEKIKRLNDQHRQLKEDNNIFLNQNHEYLETIKNQKILINQLEDKIKLLEITRSQQSMESPVKLKEQISGLVREIDKCIRLLNK